MGNVIKALVGLLPPWVWLAVLAGGLSLLVGLGAHQRSIGASKERGAFNEANRAQTRELQSAADDFNAWSVGREPTYRAREQEIEREWHD
jgi:CHASE1-domain containing sensor protein